MARSALGFALSILPSRSRFLTFFFFLCLAARGDFMLVGEEEEEVVVSVEARGCRLELALLVGVGPPHCGGGGERGVW